MKILILEDEQRNAMRLIRLLNDIDTTFIIEGPLTNIKEAVDFFQSGKTTDLILADIRLTDGLSFEALKYAPATVSIIFTTAYDEYAVQAFKFNSFDYLLKPLDADELEAAIDKATKAGKNYADENLRQLFDSLQKNQFRYRERFLLPYRDGYKTVRVSDINHIETENKTVYLRLNNGTSEVVNMSMDELEQQLNPDCFFIPSFSFCTEIPSPTALPVGTCFFRCKGIALEEHSSTATLFEHNFSAAFPIFNRPYFADAQYRNYKILPKFLACFSLKGNL